MTVETIPAQATTLPPELWLQIIPLIPYTPDQLLALRLTSKHFNALLHIHESSLTQAILHHQPSLGTSTSSATTLFPSLKISTYADLGTLWYRTQLLDDLTKSWPAITNAHKDLHWLSDSGRWAAIFRAGLYMMYRLLDLGTHDAKIGLLSTLPASSLACLFFTVISAVRVLRVLGPQPVRVREGGSPGPFGGGRSCMCWEVRSDIELAVEECLLVHGPAFFTGLLEAGEKTPEVEAEDDETDHGCVDEGEMHPAVKTLRDEISGMHSRQLPLPSGLPQPPTLISSLRKALANSAGCEVRQAVTKMWEILSSTVFDGLGEEAVVKAVRGESLGEGMKRMGF